MTDSAASDPHFWRAGAISTTVVMLAVLAILTVNSLGAIEAGGSHVPPYTVINHKIGYGPALNRNTDAPTIGGEELLFGKRYTPQEAHTLIRRGKLVIQSRACMDCHTFFGNGAYYAPDLTKAWLDPEWKVWKAMTQSKTRGEAMKRFLMNPERYPTWQRRMPNLHLSAKEAEAVVAYLKWMSSVDANGFPAHFGHIEKND